MMVDVPRKPPPLDDDGEWLRRLVLSEEYLVAHYPMACGSYWRRFDSHNVVDLMPILRQRAKRQSA